MRIQLNFKNFMAAELLRLRCYSINSVPKAMERFSKRLFRPPQAQILPYASSVLIFTPYIHRAFEYCRNPSMAFNHNFPSILSFFKLAYVILLMDFL